MVLESKPLPEEMLKETYVLVLELEALYFAIKRQYAGGEDITPRLAEMLESRLHDIESNLSDVVNPHPF